MAYPPRRPQHQGQRRPRYQLLLVLTVVSNLQATIKAILRQGDRPVPDKEISFSKDGVAEVGTTKTDSNGEATRTIALPTGVAQTRIRAEALVEGAPFREISINTGAASAPAKNLALEMESNKRRGGLYLVHFGVYDDNRVGQDAQIELVPSQPIKFNGQLEPANGHSFKFDVPKAGVVVTIEFEQRSMEIDVFVIGRGHRYELNLYGDGPKPIVAGPNSNRFEHLFDGWR